MSDSFQAPRLAVPGAIDMQALRGFDPAAPVCRFTGATMGTTWSVLGAMPRSLGLSPPDLRARIQTRLDGLVAEMSHWDETSVLCGFNRAEAGCEISLPRDFSLVIAAALEIARLSEGAFDPAQGRLTDLWGLGANPASADPESSAILAARRQSGWDRLAHDANARILRQPGGLWLDLSGIAKGHAADAIADLLGDLGIGHALVEIGGEFVGRGLRPDGDPWWVDLENPQPAAPVERSLPGMRIALHQLAVATSGDYLRGAHTLNPRTGRPAIHATTAVSVVHSRCMDADAWATALSVLEPQQALALATRQNLAARIVERSGTEWLSPSLAAMIEP